MNDCLNTSCAPSCVTLAQIGRYDNLGVFFMNKKIHSDGDGDYNGNDDDDEEGSQLVVVSGYWCTKLW